MNNKVIEVLDYLGEKFGIAIDWTTENVWPQVTEFMNRYATYEIVRSIVWIVIGLITITVSICLWRTMYKSHKKKDGFWYWNDEATVVLSIITVIASAVFVCTIADSIFNIVEWSIVPEMKFVEVISCLLKSTG